MFDSLADVIRGQLGLDGTGNDGGGGPGTTGAAVDSDLEKFQPDGSGKLALAFGKHLVRGHLFDQIYTAGPPPLNKLAIGLGEGPWNAAVKVWWAGTELTVSPDANTAGYRFHPGTVATGAAYPTDLQGVDPFFPAGLNYSSSANVALRLTEGQSAENVTDKFTGIFECLLVPDYNVAGVQTDAGSYSVNPARVIAYGAEKAGMIDRIHWPSWHRLKAFCDEEISWDDGTTVRDIPRFEAHPVWTDAVTFPAFLDAVCFLCCSSWVDDGTSIKFILPTDVTPAHHFTLGVNSNTASFKPKPPTVRDMINILTMRARDTDDPDLRAIPLVIDRPDLVAQYDEKPQEIAVANTNQNQLRRMGNYWLRLNSDFVNHADLDGYSDSFHVLPGNYVTVTAPVSGWNQVLCRVKAATDLSTSSAPDRRTFSVQRIDGAAYRDEDGAQPRQVQE